MKWPSALVRSTFVDYFVSKGYSHFPSCSIRPPHGDKSILFTNAGMNQFKPILLEVEPLPSELRGLKTATNSQKCLRVGGKHNDLSQVGLDGTHHTFFEMLGHWSFSGELTKHRTVADAWSLLTDVYGIPKDRLFVTCFEGNDEAPADTDAIQIWKDIGFPQDRIFMRPASENFWEMGNSGPCGPCTEIHYSRADPPSVEHSEELWNLVFIQYNRQESGILERLPHFHVDTGLGLERLTAVLQGGSSNYETDLFTPIMDTLSDQLGYLPKYRNRYGLDDIDQIDRSYRLLADHARAIVVTLSDGIIPDDKNEGHHSKAFIYRSVNRLLRMAGSETALRPLCEAAIELLGPVFPEIYRNKDEVLTIVDTFSKKCHKNLLNGRRLFKKSIMPKLQVEGRSVLNERELNQLRAKGLPFDVIYDILTDNDVC